MDDAMRVFFLESIRETIKPSTGCTEPGAIALNTATARKHASGAFRRLHIELDEYLYKNAMGVGIPGADARGVALCAAMGVTGGDAEAGLCVLGDMPEGALEAAKRYVAEGLVTVSIRQNADGLFIQSVLKTDCDSVRVTTVTRHDNIIEISHPPFPPEEAVLAVPADAPILRYTLDQMLEFVRGASEEELAFLQDGIDMNIAVAEAGEKLDLGRAMKALIGRGALGDSPVTQAKLLCASAAYARMKGVELPVMSATGSGNQGITVSMTIEGAARGLGVGRLEKLRALALAHLVNLYGKAHVGNLSALCSCGISSGLGASVGVVYMLGGDRAMMLAAAQNVIGSICGMICDGAKEGCANKVELASGVAVQAAFLAVEGVAIPDDNGILSGDWATLFENLGAISKQGMRETNRVIVRIMNKEND